MVSRRQFLIGGAGATLAGLIASQADANSFSVSTYDLQLSKIDVHLPLIPKAFDGFRIGIIADLHLGTCTGDQLLVKAVDLLKKENIDLLVLAGDYVLVLDRAISRFLFNQFSNSAEFRSCAGVLPSFDESLEIGEHYFAKVAREVSKLNPKNGIVAVLGNHDRWNSAENCERILKAEGINVLVNESIQISKNQSLLEIYGCDDFTTGIPEPPKSENPARIILSHNPDFLSDLSQRFSYSLGIAGHTHGGQIVLPGIGPIGLNISDQRLIQGLISLGTTQNLVSRGVGVSGLPWRINCPPEVNVITILT